MSKPLKEFFIVSIVSFLVYIVFYVAVVFTGLNPLILQSDDIVPNATMPYSIIFDQDIYLDEYEEMFNKHYPATFYRRYNNGHLLSYYSYLTPVLVSPLYLIESAIQPEVTIDNIKHMSRIGGAFLTALATGIFWIVLGKAIKSRKLQTILIFIFALGTTTVSISSQGLWEHGSSELFLSLALYLLLIRKYGLAGLALSLATVARPTNLLSFVAFIPFVFLVDKKGFFKYVVFGFLVLGIDLLIKNNLYGSLLNTGYGSEAHKFTSDFYGVLGMWLSPSKGILTNSPILIFSFYGMYLAIIKFFKSWKIDINLTLTGIIIIHTVIMGLWYSWFGGYSWSYRMSTDIVPYFVFMLIPFVTSKHFSNIFWKSTFYALMGFSILYQMLGLLYFDGLWHRAFTGNDRKWLWNVWDSEVVFSFRRLFFKLVKIGTDPFAKANPYK